MEVFFKAGTRVTTFDVGVLRGPARKHEHAQPATHLVTWYFLLNFANSSSSSRIGIVPLTANQIFCQVPFRRRVPRAFCCSASIHPSAYAKSQRNVSLSLCCSELRRIVTQAPARLRDFALCWMFFSLASTRFLEHLTIPTDGALSTKCLQTPCQ